MSSSDQRPYRENSPIVGGHCLHNPDLSCAHVIGEVVVVCTGSREHEKNGMAQEGDEVFDRHYNLKMVIYHFLSY